MLQAKERKINYTVGIILQSYYVFLENKHVILGVCANEHAYVLFHFTLFIKYCLQLLEVTIQ